MNFDNPVFNYCCRKNGINHELTKYSQLVPSYTKGQISDAIIARIRCDILPDYNHLWDASYWSVSTSIKNLNMDIMARKRIVTRDDGEVKYKIHNITFNMLTNTQYYCPVKDNLLEQNCSKDCEGTDFQAFLQRGLILAKKDKALQQNLIQYKSYVNRILKTKFGISFTLAKDRTDDVFQYLRVHEAEMLYDHDLRKKYNFVDKIVKAYLNLFGKDG